MPRSRKGTVVNAETAEVWRDVEAGKNLLDYPSPEAMVDDRAADRQRILRFLVDRVAATVEGVSDQVRVTITWAGGQQSNHEVIRPVGRNNQAADFDRLLARVRQLRDDGLSVTAIAERLNAEEFL